MGFTPEMPDAIPDEDCERTVETLLIKIFSSEVHQLCLLLKKSHLNNDFFQHRGTLMENIKHSLNVYLGTIGCMAQNICLSWPSRYASSIWSASICLSVWVAPSAAEVWDHKKATHHFRPFHEFARHGTCTLLSTVQWPYLIIPPVGYTKSSTENLLVRRSLLLVSLLALNTSVCCRDVNITENGDWT